MRRTLWAGTVLILVTLAAYWRVGECGFVNLDDDAYVEFAPMVNQGIRWPAVVWAFTAVHTSNWHPFTTLSHMLDCEIFGVRAAPMHWENVFFHLLNSVLVFLIWKSMSGLFWRSLVVAGLFALHPLHVESVAWISERKDVLSTLFWLLGLAAYLRWTRRRTAGGYCLILLSLATSLLFKPMAVTFPCTLLLIDAWPLRRLSGRNWRGLVVEKLPFFVVVAAHSVITAVVQHSAGAANYAQRFTFDQRIANAFVAFARYLGKTLWPDSLAPLYYHPGSWPAYVVVAAIGLFLAISLGAWQARFRMPWLLFGWLWFAGTLVPVIGIIQVGAQAMADRYTYVPLLGVFTIVAWGGAELVARFPRFRPAMAAAAGVALLACALLTHRQVRAWTNSITLLRHSIAVGEDNPGVRYLLGVALVAAGRREAEAIEQWQRAVEIQPDYTNAHTQLALAAARRGRAGEARQILERNITTEPRRAEHRLNLGVFASLEGKPDEAIRRLTEAIQLNPHYATAHRELAQIYGKRGELQKMRPHYAAVVRADKWNPVWLAEYGVLLANLGDLNAGRRYLERSLWIDPNNRANRDNLATLLKLQAQLK